jgi:hypothetical protein
VVVVAEVGDQQTSEQLADQVAEVRDRLCQDHRHHNRHHNPSVVQVLVMLAAAQLFGVILSVYYE